MTRETTPKIVVSILVLIMEVKISNYKDYFDRRDAEGAEEEGSISCKNPKSGRMRPGEGRYRVPLRYGKSPRRRTLFVPVSRARFYRHLSAYHAGSRCAAKSAVYSCLIATKGCQ